MNPPLIITAGDPAGIGPEVAVKAARQLDVRAVIVGQREALQKWGPELPLVDTISEIEGLCLLEPSAGDEPIEVAAIRFAVDACLSGRGAALVTGPVHKGRLAQQGFEYTGHTDFLGALCGVDPMMAFVGAGLRVGLVTTHIPLMSVSQAITTERLARCIRLCDQGLKQLGLGRRRLVVAGMNPHAGEEGLLGSEEEEIIKPVCRALGQEGLDLVGPIAAETAFGLLQRGEADMLLAMYHDQGLPPLKMVAFGQLVNWSLGLPLIRSSVDHGTADDIAGQGIADPKSMVAAIELALQLSSETSTYGQST